MEESLESNSPKPSDSAQEFVDKPDTGMAIVDELIDKIKNGEMVEKQRFVLNRLSTIRVSKGKILKHLQLMKQREDDGETINRELMQKLVDAYDGLMHQEREFITVMRSILANYKKAINFVTSEVGSLVRNETSESDSASGEARQQVKVSEKTVAELDTLIRGFNTMEGMMGEVEKASELDDQFKICVQMHIEQKKKMDLLHQIHMQEKLLTELTTKDFTDRAKTLVSNERSGLDRKQRQLERLRREAEKRGLLGGGSAQNRPPNSVSPVDSGPIIPENERIPAIPALPTPPQPSAESSNKEKDELRAKISERFASLEARKQRMRLLRKTLGSFERQKMENAYSDAVGRVQSLTEMRKKLEEVQTSLENAVSEDAHSTTRGTAQGQTDECSAKEEALEGPTADEPDADEDNHSSVSTDELILQVRRAFNNTFKRMAAESKIGDSPFSDRLGNNSSFDSALSLLNDRMKTFESILHNHTDQLTWIGNQVSSLVDLVEQHLLHSTPFQLAKQFSTTSAATIVPTNSSVPRAAGGNNTHSPTRLSPLPARHEHIVAPASLLPLPPPPPKAQYSDQLVTALKGVLIGGDPETLRHLFEHVSTLHSNGSAADSYSQEHLDFLVQKLLLSLPPHPQQSSPSSNDNSSNRPLVSSSYSFAEIVMEKQRPTDTSSTLLDGRRQSAGGLMAAESCSSSATASVRVEPVLSTKEDVSKLMMDHIIKCLEGEFGSNRAQPVTEDIGRSIVRSINEKSAEMFPTEFDEKVSENFAELFEGLMARFYGRAFEEVEQQMTDELRESIHSEFLFLQLMRSANEVLLGE